MEAPLVRHIAPVLAVVVALLGATPARADVVPGDKITDQNIDKVKDLISPGLEWCIRHGFPINIVETRRVEWPKAYKEATEKYSGQVKLSPDGLTLQNYVAGQPFPNIDPKDPQIALKIMWNYDYGFVNGIDDTDLRNFDADTGAIADHGPMTVERHFLLDHFRRLFWVARLYQDPKPEKPNPSGYRAQQGLYPILEPFDLKGVGALGNRYLDPSKQDDSWLYLPSLRRVRRLSTAQRSDALFGQDTDVDSYYGYAGQIAWMSWKYLGEKELIGVVHAEHYPVKWDDKVDWAFNDNWEKRKVYVIEGVSKLPQYAYSKRVLFIDKEAWGIPYTDIYDRSGELWKIWINDVTFRKQAPVSGAITYEDEWPFAPAIVMVDIQLEHATKASLPSPRFPGEQGWYYHQGEKAGVTDDWFTVAALVNAGH
ncbi:MAG TPA: DUF1329 domain-containing protein [Candidatus Binatia bacterium]|nr:DUF1329 domain-containing protein [Candidatus Binatia bacterium]